MQSLVTQLIHGGPKAQTLLASCPVLFLLKDAAVHFFSRPGPRQQIWNLGGSGIIQVVLINTLKVQMDLDQVRPP